MQCNCGGDTVERQIVRSKKVVCEYQRCKICGRQAVTKGAYPEAEEAFIGEQDEV